jgi:hypothetical protein
MYGYSTVAGVGDDVASSDGSSGSGGTTRSFGGGAGGGEDTPPSSSGNTCASIAPTQPYYIIKAKGDTDGDGVASTVLGLSCSNHLVLTNEGE